MTDGWHSRRQSSPVQGRDARKRVTLDGWHRTDIFGKPLRVAALSSKLTKVANFRATICKVAEEDYLLRRINGIEEPVVARANEARRAMMVVAVEMIRGLHWADFETMTDLIFARSGWQRSTRVGENLTDSRQPVKSPLFRSNPKLDRPQLTIISGDFVVAAMTAFSSYVIRLKES